MGWFSRLGNDLYSGKRSFGIVRRRKLWYAISAVLIVLSLVGLLGRGLNFGIEFRGGTEMRVSGISQMQDYEQRATETVNAEAQDADTVTVTQIGDDGVRVQTGDLGDTVSEQTRLALAEEFSVDDSQVTSSFVGPSWGDTVTTKAIQALIAFLVLVSLVLAVYFSTWKMAAAALIALVHDVVFTIGTYALLGIEVSPASVIGFLTILGYSIYDTIVVFDKVRENTSQALEHRNHGYTEAGELAVNQTIVRSLNTSIVALLPVGAILFFGVAFIGPGTLVDLAAALFIGIAVGTFSSIFIATPLLVHLREGEPEIKALDKKVAKRQAASRARDEEQADDAESSDGDDDEAHDEGSAPVGSGVGAGSAGAAGKSDVGRMTGRPVHPYAQRGPRNQPKRKPRRR